MSKMDKNKKEVIADGARKIAAIGFTAAILLSTTACNDVVEKTNCSKDTAMDQTSITENSDIIDNSFDISMDNNNSDISNPDCEVSDNPVENSGEVSEDSQHDYRKAYAEHVLKEIEEYGYYFYGIISQMEPQEAEDFLSKNGYFLMQTGINTSYGIDPEHGCNIGELMDLNDNMLDAYSIEFVWVNSESMIKRVVPGGIPVGNRVVDEVCEFFNIPLDQKGAFNFNPEEILAMDKDGLDMIVKFYKESMNYYVRYNGWDDFNPDNISESNM